MLRTGNDQIDGDKRLQGFAILLRFNGLTWLFKVRWFMKNSRFFW